MALPSVSKTYTYNVNNAVVAGATLLANYQDLWYNIKVALKAGGWTVQSSSNSVTANTSDNWTATTSLVWNSNTVAHSWIVLRHPSCLWDLCIVLNSNASSANGTIAISRNGYSTAGLVTTARPATTSSDEQVLTNISQLAWGGTQQNFVWHYVRSTDGEVQRVIVCVADVPVWAFCMDVPQSPVANWNPTATPPGVTVYGNAGSVATCLGTTTYTTALGNTRMGAAAGTAVTFFLGGQSYNGNLLVNGLTVPNDVSGEYPLVSTSYISSTAPYRGQMGQVYDLWFGVSNLATGTTYPADNSRQFAQFGSLVIPWNGTVPVTR